MSVAHRRMRALVIDDNDDNRWFLRRVLRGAGFDVIEATTGAEGLALVDPLLDLAVIDVRLPDMSGLDVTAQIRSHPTARRVPVIQRSSVEIDDGSRSAGLDVGADAYLPEPISPELLLATARTVMRSRLDGTRLEAALTVHGGGTWEWEAADGQVVCSAAVAAIHGLGQAPVALALADFAALVGPGGRQLWEALPDQPHEEFRAVYRAVDGPGADAWVEAYGRVSHDGGRPVRAMGVAIDVTERERRRIALEQVRHLAADLVGETDPDEVLRRGWAALQEASPLVRGPVPERIEDVVTALRGRGAPDTGPDRRADDADPAGGPSTEAMVDLLRTAFDRASRFQIERRNADALRAAVIPRRLVQVDGYELRAAYAPAGRDDQAGGDFYDAFVGADGGYVFVLGDVAGHGVATATACVGLRQMLRLAMAERGPDPGAVLVRLDEIMVANGDGAGPMATAVIGRLDPGRAEVSLVAAGHPDPFLLPHDAPPRPLALDRCPPLGFGLLRREPEARRHQLRRGDGLLVFTDGLFEARREDLAVSLERFRLAVAGLPHPDLPGALLTDVEPPRVPGSDDAAADDRAALALFRSTGPGSTS